MMLMLIRVIWVHSGRGSRRVTASPALPNCDLDHYHHFFYFLIIFYADLLLPTVILIIKSLNFHYQDDDDHHLMIKWQHWVIMQNHTLCTAKYHTNPTIRYETYARNQNSLDS